MPPAEREAVDADDPTVRHLEAALDAADHDAVRYHIRQALQHQLIAAERDDD